MENNAITLLGHQIIKDTPKYIEVKRQDGLQVFLDKGDSKFVKELNQIRLTGSKEQVVSMVGLLRGYQIALNYAKKAGIELPDFTKLITTSYKELLCENQNQEVEEITNLNLLNITQEQKEEGIWFSGIEGEGEFKQWYRDGNLFEHSFYKDGKRHGEFKRWWDGGNLKEHAFYENGVRVKYCLK